MISTELASFNRLSPNVQPTDIVQYERVKVDAVTLAFSIWGEPQTADTLEPDNPRWSLPEDLNDPQKYVRIRIGWDTFIYDDSNPSTPGFRKDIVNDRGDHFGYGTVLVRDPFSFQRALGDDFVSQ